MMLKMNWSFSILCQMLVFPIATSDEPCGRSLICRSIHQDRIIGGTIASTGEFPWIVSLRKFDNHFCGATIIAKEWVLTAAHCVQQLSTQEFALIAGRLNLNQTDTLEQKIPIKEIYVHPDYEYDGLTYYNDLALLKLQQPLNFIKLKVSPVCLPKTDQESSGSCILAGWGYTKEHGSLSQALRKVTVPLIDDEECQRHYQFHKIIENMVCTWNENGGKDSCQGDSGSPLLCLNEKRTRYYVAGIVSWGVGCGRPNYPGICTQVSKYVPWIHDIMQKY